MSNPAKVIGWLLAALALIGAFNDIQWVHLIWLSMVFVLPHVVFAYLGNDGTKAVSSTFSAKLLQLQQVALLVLGIFSLSYPLLIVVVHIPFNSLLSRTAKVSY